MLLFLPPERPPMTTTSAPILPYGYKISIRPGNRFYVKAGKLVEKSVFAVLDDHDDIVGIYETKKEAIEAANRDKASARVRDWGFGLQ
jgi:hypothetical protein